MCGRSEAHKRRPLRVPSKLGAKMMQQPFPVVSAHTDAKRQVRLGKDRGEGRIQRQRSRARHTTPFSQTCYLGPCKGKELKCRMALGALKLCSNWLEQCSRTPVFSLPGVLPPSMAVEGLRWGNEGAVEQNSVQESSSGDQTLEMVSRLCQVPRAAIRRQGILTVGSVQVETRNVRGALTGGWMEAILVFRLGQGYGRNVARARKGVGWKPQGRLGLIFNFSHLGIIVTGWPGIAFERKKRSGERDCESMLTSVESAATGT